MAEIQPGRFIPTSQLPVAGSFDANDFLLGLTGVPLNSRRIRLESLLAFLEAKIVETAVAQAVGQAIALLSNDGQEALQKRVVNASGELVVADGVTLLLAGSVFTLPALPAKCFSLFINLTGTIVTIAGQNLPVNSIAMLVCVESIANGKLGIISTGGWTDV